MATKKKKKTGARPVDGRVQVKRYTEKTLKEDREYGLFWYAWLWRIIRPVMVLLCSLIIVAGLVSSGWNKIYGEFLSPVDVNATEMREFVIESGSSVSTVGSNLLDQGFVRNKGIFKYIVQFRGLTSSIQYGSYQLSPSMNVMEVVNVLSAGSVTTERTITIIPGWTVEDIANYLVETGALRDPKEFLDLCNRPEEFMDESYALQRANEAGFDGRLYALEGYLAPDTYQVFTNASPKSIISKLLGQTDKVVNREIYADAETEVVYDENGNIVETEESARRYETKLTPEETIILASIIEREAGRKEDYGKVSAVFHNRLNSGMKLESDATITYVLRVDRLSLSGEDLSMDSPYNSYRNAGLPPGPICNPSAAAIEAAMYPDMDYIDQNYLYFCSKEPESGELAFAVTYEEHQRNVDKYRPSWIEYDRRKAAEAAK